MRDIKLLEGVVLGIMAGTVFVGLILSAMAPEVFDNTFVAEDGVVEWGTVVLMLMTALVCLRRFLVFCPELRVGRMLLALFFTLFFLFVAGEEISWGQRILGFGSGSWFEQHNAQHEANLHNLVVGGHKINKLVFSNALALVVLLYLVVVVPLHHRSPRFAALVDSAGFPIARGYQIVAGLTAVLITETLISSSRRGELLELAGSALALLVVAFPRNREALDH